MTAHDASIVRCRSLGHFAQPRSFTLELAAEADIEHLEQVLPRIVDNFQVYLRELRIEDLKGSAGIYRLREELLLRVNAAAYPAEVRDVLFKEMLIQ